MASASPSALPATVRSGSVLRALWRRYALGVVFLLIAIVWLGPAFWALTTSLKVPSDVIRPVPIWLPHPVTLKNYQDVFAVGRTGGITRPVINSGIYAVLVTLATLFVCVVTAYPLARMQFPGRKLVFATIIGSMMVPDVVTLVPLYLLTSSLGWLNTFAALVVPNVASAFGVFLLHQFFISLPGEMEDAARMDGANSWQILSRILLPLCQPALIALTIFTVRNSWNDFTWPLIVTASEQMYTLPVALAILHTDYVNESYGPIMAGAVVSAIPILIVFIFANRYIVEGVQLSGLKG